MEWQRLRWEKGTRYYEAYLEQDLWGQWVLTRVWGRRQTTLGRLTRMPCDSYEEGLKALAGISKRRAQRGYGVVVEASESRLK